MLPLTVLRRFDCVLEQTKPQVLAKYKTLDLQKLGNAVDPILNKIAGERFHNHSDLDFQKLKGDPEHISQHLQDYINGFSANVRRIFERFEFTNEIEKMVDANVLAIENVGKPFTSNRVNEAHL
jgi:type I restriction enzyme M protein